MFLCIVLAFTVLTGRSCVQHLIGAFTTSLQCKELFGSWCWQETDKLYSTIMVTEPVVLSSLVRTG